jgi:hypothetical protein
VYVRNASEPLVAPPSWLRSCCLAPRSAIRAPLVVQSLLSITHVHRDYLEVFLISETRRSDASTGSDAFTHSPRLFGYLVGEPHRRWRAVWSLSRLIAHRDVSGVHRPRTIRSSHFKLDSKLVNRSTHKRRGQAPTRSNSQAVHKFFPLCTSNGKLHAAPNVASRIAWPGG